ncbi:MAG: thermonuclease family protein [Actinomycetota bacterium]|nr:thermonuclease family protein [Actinomycetota bacterium]
MSDLAAIVLLIGAGVTAVTFAVLFAKRYPKRRSWLAFGIVVGLAAMFLWPFTLWAALAMWLTGFARTPGSQAPGPSGTGQPAPADIAAHPASRAVADAHLPKKIVIPLCSLGALVTLVVIGLTVEPVPASETGPVAAPTTTAPPTSNSALPPTVVDVTDGDTVYLSNGRTVQIIGIDSPETVVSGKPVDCWGSEATGFARQTLLNKSVTVITDPTQDRMDSAGRMLSYILLPDGRDFSVLAAEGGHARAYMDKVPPQRYGAISAAESRARAAGLGLWGPACVPPPPLPLLPLAPEPEPEPDSGGLAYYDNCSDARSAGAAPLYAGDPGYRSGLDRDGDGVACES